MPAAVCYCRLSDPLARDAPSLDTQEAQLRAHCAEKGYEVVAVLRENYTGAVLRERPRVRELLALLEQGGVDVVVVRDVDRLVREQWSLAVFLDLVREAGARVEFALETFEETPTGKLLLNVRAFAAEYEREKIKWRTVTGKRRRLETGKLHSSSVEKYGYVRDKESGRRSIHEAEAAVIRRIYQWVEDGASTREVWKRLNDSGTPSPGSTRFQFERPVRWSKSQIARILRNELYKGETYGWKTKRHPVFRSGIARPREEWIALPEGTTPAIVSPEQWERVQRRLDEGSAAAARNATRPYLLRGWVRCLECGAALYSGAERGVRVYRCSSRDKGGACGIGRRVRADDLEAWVWGKVAAFVKRRDVSVVLTRESKASRAKPEPDGLDERAASLRQQQRRYLDLYADALDVQLVDLKAKLAKVARELGDVQARIAARDAERARQAPAEAAPRLTVASLQAFYDRIAETVDTLTFDERRDALDWLEVRVLASGRDWRLTTRDGLLSARHQEKTRAL